MTHPEDTETLEPELQELALTLAAEAPRPEPEFAERLRGRVEAGFPRPTRAHRRARSRRAAFGTLAHDLAPLAGVVATILLIVGVVLVAGGGSSSEDGGSGGGGSEAASSGSSAGGGSGGGAGEGADTAVGKATDSARSTPAADTPTAAEPLQRSDLASPSVTPFQSGRNFAPNQPNRRIERTFSMELSVPVKEMTRVADQVSAVAYRHGGFVLSSSVDSGDDGGGGDFSLRIPTAELRPALRDLGKLAPVANQSQRGRDVTRQHVTAKDRLQAARAERRSLLRRLAEADTDEEAESIRRRLDLVAGEINGLQAQLRDLRLRTNYAVVDVTLSEAQKDKGQLGSFGDSLDDAGNLLAGFAGLTIRVLALALPLGLIALMAWLAARALRRRRRESALV
jgi:hypothetical protein